MVHIIGEKNKEDQPKVEEIVQAIQYIAIQVNELRQFCSAIAKKNDINTLTISALANLLVKNNVTTEEDLETMIQKDVIEVYQKMEKEAQEEVQKRQLELQKQINKEQDLSNTAIKETKETFQKNRKK